MYLIRTSIRFVIFLEREMARLKEQSRVERERRHLEKASKRKLYAENEQLFNKKTRLEPHIVTVSDNSEGEVEEIYEDQEDKSDVSVHSESSSKHSRSISQHSNEVRLK